MARNTLHSVIKEGRAAMRLCRAAVDDSELTRLLRNLPQEKRRIIERGCQTGACISVQPSTINGTELSAEEFHDATHLRCAQVPPNFPTTCEDAPATMLASNMPYPAR
jgi:hypothetical protein